MTSGSRRGQALSFTFLNMFKSSLHPWLVPEIGPLQVHSSFIRRFLWSQKPAVPGESVGRSVSGLAIKNGGRGAGGMLESDSVDKVLAAQPREPEFGPQNPRKKPSAVASLEPQHQGSRGKGMSRISWPDWLAKSMSFEFNN